MNTVSTRKQIVEKYIDGFRRTDHAQILSCLTDDVVWELHGYRTLRGKDAFDAEIENDDLGQGELFALCALYVFQEVEDGAEQLRRIRDRHRPLAVKVPRRSRWGQRGWGAR